MIKVTESLTLHAIVSRLKQEGFGRVRLISKGGQGATFRVVKEGSIYCLKLFVFSDCARAEYNHQSQVWRRATHQRYLVGFHETVKQLTIGLSKASYILMDYNPYTLSEMMQSEHVATNAMKLYRQILIGVQQFHHIGLAHSDIKPSNIMLTTEGEPRLADFGLVGPAKRIAGQGTKLYAAPEVFSNLNQANIIDYQKADIYSLGLLLLRMLSQSED